jgi:hypothetical protein
MDAVLPLTESHDADHLVLAYSPRRRAREQEEDEESDEDDNESRAVPYYPFGVIFLRRIQLNTIPRMRVGGRTLTAPAFKHIFKASYEEIEYKYFRTGLIPQQAMATTRVVTNKSQRTATWIPEPGDESKSLFNLGDRGLNLPPRPVDEGSDMEFMSDSEDDEENIDIVVTRLYRQLLCDIMCKAPNPRGVDNPSYCKLTREERLSVSEDVFHNRSIPALWRKCQYKRVSKNEFNLAFNHLFPARDHKTGPKVQNYTQCQYYVKWKEICTTATPATVDIIRQEIRKRLVKFAWLPHACQHKMWSTKHYKEFKQYPSDSPKDAAAPRVLFFKEPEL